ncbi:MAG TPA: hypothetical protein VGE01_02595, partial [Fimbriimonas sp.]
DAYSYGYLRFDLKDLPKDSKITKADLLLTHTADPAYTLSLVKDNPLEVRPLKGVFTEKDWEYDLVTKISPDEENGSVLGSAHPETINADGKTFVLTIDLLKGPGAFAKAAVGGQALHVALTSKISPEVGGQRAVYKVYSKDAETEANRPKLVLSYEPAESLHADGGVVAHAAAP